MKATVILLGLLCLSLSSWAADTLTPPRALVGAIRWDAWHGDAGKELYANSPKNELWPPGLAVERALSPKHWHYRLPFYAKVISDNEVQVRANSRKVMDQEIAYASKAGLDYWAFLTYAPDNPMSIGLNLYLSSRDNSRIRFCMILALIRLDALPEETARIVGYLKHKQYVKVLDGRPLLFMLQCPAPKSFYDDIRNAAVAAGLKPPYFVLMEGTWKQAQELGFDAVGSYTGLWGPREWDAIGNQGGKVVTSLSSGWDRRPRVENPVPWEPATPQKVVGGPNAETWPPWFIALRVWDCLDWTRKHPQVAEANAVLIYAWNEFDEGGWICPTLENGSDRLDAIEKVLKTGERPERPK